MKNNNYTDTPLTFKDVSDLLSKKEASQEDVLDIITKFSEGLDKKDLSNLAKLAINYNYPAAGKYILETYNLDLTAEDMQDLLSKKKVSEDFMMKIIDEDYPYDPTLEELKTIAVTAINYDYTNFGTKILEKYELDLTAKDMQDLLSKKKVSEDFMMKIIDEDYPYNPTLEELSKIAITAFNCGYTNLGTKILNQYVFTYPQLRTFMFNKKASPESILESVKKYTEEQLRENPTSLENPITLVKIALTNGYLTAGEYILDKFKIDVNPTGYVATPILYHTALSLCSDKNDIVLHSVYKLLTKYEANPNVRNDSGKTTLHVVNEYGHEKKPMAAALLLAAGANPLIEKDIDMNAPIDSKHKVEYSKTPMFGPNSEILRSVFIKFWDKGLIDESRKLTSFIEDIRMNAHSNVDIEKYRDTIFKDSNLFTCQSGLYNPRVTEILEEYKQEQKVSIEILTKTPEDKLKEPVSEKNQSSFVGKIMHEKSSPPRHSPY